MPGTAQTSIRVVFMQEIAFVGYDIGTKTEEIARHVYVSRPNEGIHPACRVTRPDVAVGIASKLQEV
ncbi:hypothetical protein [Candidatus Brocadia sinica]|uniref:hypothetical protein n=1 Tax=Candidatus Brocadia sinica TaxID=795830 RepID=UPI0006978972|nr:hypothetical protein [Candidatus Brocadia sinica]NOG43394.1 hypothetical protein [Planctomycetota bacterium]GJQ19610.1 MAG: hypothetical protein HBSIN01_35690 [Candidatus Brocadia sinica]